MAEVEFRALIDTGADITILDETIAYQLGIDLNPGPTVRLGGIGSGGIEGRLANVSLIPLAEPALEVLIPVAFVPGIATTLDNLIGRDVLEYLDFGLSHSTRVGYLGRTETRP